MPYDLNEKYGQKAFAEAASNEGAADSDEAKYAAHKAKRDALYNKLLGTDLANDTKTELTYGILHALSGLSYLGGPSAGKAGMDAARRAETNALTRERESKKANFGAGLNLLGVEDSDLAREEAGMSRRASAKAAAERQKYLDERHGKERGEDRADKAADRAARLRAAEIKAKSKGGAGGTGGPNETFVKTANREAGKAFGSEKASMPNLDNEIVNLDDAMSSLKEYSRSTMAGTGPIATGFGAKKLVDSKLQALDAKFRKLSLATLVKMFEGKSRMMDSNTERAAFEATQPNVAHDDQVNAQILLGGKILALKAKVDREAKERHMMTSPNGILDYKSPIEDLTAVVSPSGEVQLVPRDAKGKALEQGWMDPDQYVEKEFPNAAKFGESQSHPVDTMSDDEVRAKWRQQFGQ